MSAGPRVAALARALYAELGAAAPALSADAAVVRAHEAARAFGELALAAEAGGPPVVADPDLSLLLARAAREDATGWTVLYDLAAVVGPRLLRLVVELRRGADAADASLLDSASDLISAEIVATRAALPTDGNAPAWRAAARESDAALERAGFSVTLGVGRGLRPPV